MASAPWCASVPRRCQWSVRPSDLAGRAVRAWRVTPTRIVLWAYDDLGRPWPHLPPRAAAYVSRHTEALERRTDYRTGPPWTVFRTAGATSGMRVVWADLARRPGAVLLEASEHPSAVPLNSCYVARFDDESLAFAAAAVLNSRWSESACSLLGDEARGGYRRINARVAGRLPIPADTTRIAALVDLSRRAHHGESVDRTAIDDAVAHALDLPTRTVDGLRALAARHR
jgi:hypothetical protein